MRKTTSRTTAAALALALAVVLATPAGAEDAAGFAAAIERAHGIESWRGKRALEADLEVEMGGTKVLAGRLLMRPDTSASRLTLADGTVMVWNGKDAWVSPSSSQVPMARFHLLTWPYFIAAPFKLRDPGARLEPLGERPFDADGRSFPAARLTFDAGIGDTPDDWYLVYRDRDTGLLKALAYIVTYGRGREAAEKEPHALVYAEPVTVDGVTLATAWTLHDWNAESGVGAHPQGRGRLSNLRFVEPPAGAFDKPADAKRDELPPR